MRKYNYFDDDDELEEVQSSAVPGAIKARAAKGAALMKTTFSSLKEKASAELEKRRLEKEARAEKAKETEEAKPLDSELTPPMPSLSEQTLRDINNDDIAHTYVAPPVAEVKLPEAEEIALPSVDENMREAEAEAAVHRITEAEREIADSEPSEVKDAILAFSHKSGDRADIAKPAQRIKTVAETVIENNPIEVIERVSPAKRFFITVGLLLFTVLFFVGVVFFFMRSINAENDRIHEFNANAGEVCADYVMKYGSANYENLYNTYGVQGFRLTGLCFARELDFNGDGSSELMLCYLDNGEYYNDVWGYNSSGDFELLFSDKAAQSEDKSEDAWATLYYKNNKYLIAVHDYEDLTQVAMYQMKGDKFTKKFNCTYDAVTEAYVVDDEPDLVSFERIKLSVLIAEKAIVSADEVMNTLDGFSGTESVIAAPGTAQTIDSAYYTIVQEYNKRYGTSSYVEKDGKAYVDGLAVVDLIDFDADGQDELLLVYRKQIKVRDEDSNGEHVTKNVDKYYCDIYRYNGSRAVLAYTNEGISATLADSNDVYYMLHKTGKAYNYCINNVSTENYGREIYASTSEMEYNGTDFKSYLNASYEEQYGYSEYYVEGESVKKSVFDDTTEGIALFGDTGENYDKDEYIVTYVQRKTTNAGNMKQIPNDTEKTIKKLNSQYQAN